MTFKSLNRYLTGLCICGVSECGRCPAVDGSLSGQNKCLECTESLGKMYLGFPLGGGGGVCISFYHVQLMKDRDKEREM